MRSSPSARRGFTLLELILAMTIFTILGTMVIYLMRQGLDVFTVGTRDATLQDRTETVLPRLVRDLEGLALPASFDPPPPGPSEEEQMAGVEAAPLPPVAVRLRAGWTTLRDVPEGPLKSLPCYFFAFVVNVSEDRSDPWLRRAGEQGGPGQRELVPSEIDQAGLDTAFEPSGGLREVCYVTVPEDPDYPGLLTLYHGFRSPVGGAGTLLDPANLDSLEEIRERCRPIAKGVLHLEARWRRVFATSWEPTTGAVGEHGAYVGPVWDSTRALDRTFPLFRAPASLGDASDDLFPAWVRLEMGLIAPSTLGLGRGETTLAQDLQADDVSMQVEDALPLVGPGPEERWVKVGGEWMRYRAARVDVTTGQVWVERGLRGTPRLAHDAGSEVYVGLSTQAIVRLLFRDHYARKEGR